MGKQWHSAVKTLADNLDRLMKAEGMSDRAAELKCGVGHKTINNMRHARHAPELDNVEKVAKLFGLQAWMMLVPDIKPEDLRKKPVHKLVGNYLASTEAGRVTIEAVAESAPKTPLNQPPVESVSA